MRSVLNISEAFSLALHAAAVVASLDGGKKATARVIASRLEVSEAHLSKVMQRMARAGILDSARGPGGGFSLSRPAGEITLLEVYEAVEGALRLDGCLMGARVCAGKGCVFSSLVETVNGLFTEYLERTTVGAIEDVVGG